MSPSQGPEGNVGSPMPILTLPTSPLPEGTFPAPEQEIPPTKSDGGRQVLGKSSSDEPSTIFFAGTPAATKGMSVSDTPTEMSVHPTPQTQTQSERAPSDTQTELKSETPRKSQTLNLDHYVTKEKFNEEISKRDREISALKTRLSLAEINVQMTQAAIQAIQKQLAALSTPPIQSIKDSSTEGEKKTQGAEEKEAEAEVAVEVKAQEANVAVTQGESSFSTHLEEGEIDEPYVPEYVDEIFTNEEFTADEAQVDEEDEFADEYAFHDDCLLTRVKEIITKDI